MSNDPTILVYRRSHIGDPNEDGVFGCNDCMGSVRQWQYNAVIGIGGKNPWKGCESIARKINWVGISPEAIGWKGKGPLLKFKKYILYEDTGPKLYTMAPRLYEYMFENGKIPRAGKNFPRHIYNELRDILTLAEDAPFSRGRKGNRGSKKDTKSYNCN